MLGDNIRRVRKGKRMSINKLSELSGVSLGYLSDLENNKVSNPTLDKLGKIAETLEVTTDVLLKMDENETLLENKKTSPVTEEVRVKKLMKILKDTGAENLSDDKIDALIDIMKSAIKGLKG